MFNDHIPSSTHQDQHDEHEHDDDHDHHHHHHHHESIRDIHTLTPPQPPYHHPWETTSHQSSSLSLASAESENFTTMSREFNALVLAGTGMTRNPTSGVTSDINSNNIGLSSNLERIQEDVMMAENNPLAIVRDDIPIPIVSSPRHGGRSSNTGGGNPSEVTVQSVKKEEVESKISAWQNAKISKINNRFKRDEAIINGWENEEVRKSSLWMNKIERKLEAKRAHAMEKMQNDIAKACRKAEERRATSEAKRGTKVARVMEVANLMRVVGRAPAKRHFF